MAQSKEERSQIANSFGWGMAPAFTNPMMTILADLNGTVLEGVATAHKEWAEFVQRRIREDVAVSRQLLNCHSLADIHQIYSQYFQTAFEQYREQSEKVVQRSESMAQHLAATTDSAAKNGARARH
jgi:cation transport regulator ChaB